MCTSCITNWQTTEDLGNREILVKSQNFLVTEPVCSAQFPSRNKILAAEAKNYVETDDLGTDGQRPLVRTNFAWPLRDKRICIAAK